MKVSLNQVKKYAGIELPETDELVGKINRQLGKVERVIDLAAKYRDVLIVKVVFAEKMADSDHLSVTKIDDGGVIKDIERDGDGYIQVVCGAPNVRSDMYAVWLPPHSVVPNTFGSNEPFTLESRKLRGVMSNGMLAATDELDFDNNHETILEVNPSEVTPSGVEVKAGVKFASVFGLDDTVLDIENKMFTHRPDLFGQIGVAREIAAIVLGVDENSEDTRYQNPDWYWQIPQFADASGLELETFNEIVDKVPRLMFVAMNGVKVASSPLWLQCEIVAMGGKPINNVVDLTNYLMLLTAQPTHAYDYAKLHGHKIGTRMARDGETVKLLNGKQYKLTSDDIVVADGEVAVGLGGIMGGFDSEVDENTTNIVIEVATFDMYTVRKSSMRHGLFTDALTRFNKGQSPLQNSRVLAHLLALFSEIVGARQASAVYDQPGIDGRLDETTLHGKINLSTKFINSRLGVDLTSAQIASLLRRVNFAVIPDAENDDLQTYVAPYWRTDIELDEDIIEEVGRLYGFDKARRELPMRSAMPVTDNRWFALRKLIRKSLSAAGANEVLSYSFVHKRTLDNARQDSKLAFTIANALSPDLQYYRLSLLPSLLGMVRGNIRAGYDNFALFEVGKAHHKDELADGLPIEFRRLASVYAAKNLADGAAYYRAKEYLQTVVGDIAGQLKLIYRPLADVSELTGNLQSMVAPFDPERSALCYYNDRLLAVVGEFDSDVVARFKLPEYSAGFEVDLAVLEEAWAQRVSVYQELSRFPHLAQDLSLKLPINASYSDLTAEVEATIEQKMQSTDTRVAVSPRAIYRPDAGGYRVITYHLDATSYSRTLTERDINKLVAYIVKRTAQKYQAEQA